jgi:hypothetical protein
MKLTLSTKPFIAELKALIPVVARKTSPSAVARALI